VIFVDVPTIVPSNVGALVRALAQLCDADGSAHWCDGVVYLMRTRT
jgi:hypothetical protein